MLNVKELLKKEIYYNDDFLTDLLESEANEIAIITRENFGGLNSKNEEQRREFLEKFHLAAMFDLSNPIIGLNSNVFLYIFTKQKVTDFKVGLFKNRIEKKRRTCRNEIDVLHVIDEFPNNYNDYITSLENWVNNGVQPDEETENYSFYCCSSVFLENDLLSPRRYTKRVFLVKCHLLTKDLKRLSEVAIVIKPTIISKESATVITASSLHYPLKYNELRRGKKTNTPLLGGDIIVRGGRINSLYFVEKTPDIEIHPYQNDIIIRADGISPEYLYVYLKSETAQIIMESKTQGTIIKRIPKAVLSYTPIIIPKKDEEEYKNICYLINHSDLKSSINATLKNHKYYNTVSLKKEEINSLEDILHLELIQTIENAHSKAVKALIEDDVKELNACFRVKAYKATIILAGSILEAVLLDWLSEIDGKDYFSENYMVKKNNQSKMIRGNLFDYINAIEGLKKPKWVKEAEKAHEIRKKRNLVHAKLVINSNDVNEETCKKVVNYLQYVIKTRVK